MALGSASGGAGSSLSSSNLSASAPPFTVDRFNPNPVVKFTDMPYAAAVGASPFAQTWQYNPSESRFDGFPKSGLDMPTTTECQNSISAPINPARATQWSGISNHGDSTPMRSNDYPYSLSEPVNQTDNQWSGVKEVGTKMPALSNGYSYSVPEVANPSGSKWSGSPFGQTWQYHPPHSSETRLDASPKAALAIGNPTSTRVVNPSSSQWTVLNSGVSSSNAFYVAEAKPFSPGYVSSVVREDYPLVSISESGCGPLSASGPGSSSSQAGYIESLSGLEYVPQWGGVSSGIAEAKWGKHVEPGGSVASAKVNVTPLVYKNFIAEDPALQNLDVFRGDSVTVHGKSTARIVEERPYGSYSIIDSNAKPLFVQELGSGFSSGNSAQAIRKKDFDSSFGGGNVNDEVTFAHKPSFLPFDSSGTQSLGPRSPFSETQPPDQCLDSSNFFNYQKKYVAKERFILPLDPVMEDSASLVKPSRAVVIRAPSNDTSSPAGNLVPHKTISTGNDTNACRKLLDSPNPSKGKEPCVLPGPEGIDGCLNTSKLDAVKEFSSSKPQNGDPIGTALKRKTAPDVIDTNFLPGLSLSLDHVRAVTYADNPPSDSLDNPNQAVDSPCWKGAPASHYFPLGVDEATDPLHLQKEPERSYNVDFNRNNIVLRGSDAIGAASRKPSDGNSLDKFECTENDVASSSMSTSDSRHLVKEHRSADGGINFNDASEGGAIAYHAAENVLCSPSSQENSVQHQLSGAVAPPRADVSRLINAIHNLSELLHFSFSADSCGLKEQDKEVLRHVISNLDACMPKNSNSSPAPEPMVTGKGTSNKTGDSHDLPLSKCAAQSPQAIQETVKCYDQHGHEYMYTEKINFSRSGEKAECEPFMDNASLSSDDDMVQAIKKILDENFTCEEEMQSQSLLFKNLWLEAEAKLCSITYRARFNHLRTQMNKINSNENKGIAADVGKISLSDDSPRFKGTYSPASQAEVRAIPDGTIADFSKKTHVGDIEPSVMTRFNLLKNRDNLSTFEEPQHRIVDTREAGDLCPEGAVIGHSIFRNSPVADVETSVLARYDLIRCRDEKSNAEDQLQLGKVNTGKTDTVIDQSAARNAQACDDPSVFARFNMLRSRDERSESDDQQLLDMADTRGTEGKFRSSLPGFDLEEGEFGSYVGGFDTEEVVTKHSTFSTESHADDVDASDLARFNILERHEDKSKTEDQELSDKVSAIKADVSGYGSMKEFRLSVANDPVIQPDRSGRFESQLLPGWYDTSLDWEHVLKDDFAWQK